MRFETSPRAGLMDPLVSQPDVLSLLMIPSHLRQEHSGEELAREGMDWWLDLHQISEHESEPDHVGYPSPASRRRRFVALLVDGIVPSLATLGICASMTWILLAGSSALPWAPFAAAYFALLFAAHFATEFRAVNLGSASDRFHRRRAASIDVVAIVNTRTVRGFEAL